MNDIFSINRFGHLLQKHFRENIRKHLIQALSIWTLMLVIYAICIMSGRKEPFLDNMQFEVFAFGLLGTSCLFSSQFYGFFASKPKAIQFLQLPASKLEKLLHGFLITQVLFFAVYLVMFYTVDAIAGALYDSIREVPKVLPKGDTPEMYRSTLLDITGRPAQTIIVMFLILSSVAHFGSLMFVRNSFVKTTVAVITIFFIVLGSNNIMISQLFPNHGWADGVIPTQIKLDNGESGLYVRLPEAWKTFIAYFIPIILYLCFWTGSFFKLKEKQA